MKSQVEIETRDPEQVKKIVEPSLQSGDKVEYIIEAEDDLIRVKVDADGLGVLRGCTDTVFRLTTLTEKLY